MSKGAYIGVNDVAREMKGGYIGVNDVARKIKKAYVGDANGKARLWWETEPAYLTFSSPSVFSIKVIKPGWDGTMEYSMDAQTWYAWSGNEVASTEKLYFRGTGNTQFSAKGSGFTIAGSNVSCNGNIETLLDYATVKAGGHPTMANSCYRYMFYGCTNLTTAPALPATTLADYCYQQMFSGCTSLTTAPALPATTLTEYCYGYMFYGCTSLTTAPALPATTLADYCYTMMFQGCTSLTIAPSLPATTLAEYCYDQMFCLCSKVKLSAVATNEYTQEYRIPTSGTGTTATDALTYMFLDTGGTFTGTPSINTTYYLHKDCTIV